MRQFILGIDVSRNKFNVALLGNSKPQYRHYPNAEAGCSHLGNWLRNAGVKTLEICLAAVGQYWKNVAILLHNQGYQVSVVNPARIEGYVASELRHLRGRKGKAELIALYCQREVPALWTPPPDSFRELHDLVDYLDHLNNLVQQERNRLYSGVTYQLILDQLKDGIAFLSKQMIKVTADIVLYVDQCPELKQQKELLRSIPGIGDTPAAILLGELGDVSAFSSVHQLAGYAGLALKQRDSGMSAYKRSRQAKKGNLNLRMALSMIAPESTLDNPILQALKERLAVKGRCSHFIRRAAMYKLLDIVYKVIKTGKPLDSACVENHSG